MTPTAPEDERAGPTPAEAHAAGGGGAAGPGRDGGRGAGRTVVRLTLGLLAFVLIGWGAGAVWVSIVGTSELGLVQDVTRQRTAELTALAKVVTWGGSAYVLVPLALVCCLALVRAGLRREAVAVAVSLGGGMLIYDLVKLLVARPRPTVEHLQAVAGSSFPSGHATQASAFWFSLALAAPSVPAAARRRRVVWVLAAVIVAAVALSRVYLGVHYPSDVIAGVALGTGWAIYVARCIEVTGSGSACEASL